MILKSNKTTAYAVCRIDSKGRKVIDSNILQTWTQAREWRNELATYGWIHPPSEAQKWMDAKVIKIEITKL